MGAYLVVLFASVVVGAVMGLIPYFLGCYMGKRELGQLGFICCALTGLIHWGLPFLVAFCFVFAIFFDEGRHQHPKKARSRAAGRGVCGAGGKERFDDAQLSLRTVKRAAICHRRRGFDVWQG